MEESQVLKNGSVSAAILAAGIGCLASGMACSSFRLER